MLRQRRPRGKLPFVGALIGVVFEWILKGKPTAAGRIAAQGTLGVDDPAEPDA
jgi:hypothetical protein